MTSDRPPKMLVTLEDRLRSRFEWGLIADIKFTNLETRVAILKKKEEQMKGVRLGDEIRLYIASRLKSNIRELEGFLRRVQAYTLLNNQEVSLPVVKEIMKELLPPEEWIEDAPVESAPAPALPPPALAVPVAPAPIPVPVMPPEPPPAPPVYPPMAALPVEAAPLPVAPEPIVPDLSALDAPSNFVKGDNAQVLAVPSNPGDIPVVFFFPQGHEKELLQMKKKFEDIIKKHKLKFSLYPALEVSYAADTSVSYDIFVSRCLQAGVNIAVVLGPSSDQDLSEAIFFHRLQEIFDQNEMSLQLVPWDELTKDYRFLNLALDITLIRIKQKGKP